MLQNYLQFSKDLGEILNFSKLTFIIPKYEVTKKCLSSICKLNLYKISAKFIRQLCQIERKITFLSHFFNICLDCLLISPKKIHKQLSKYGIFKLIILVQVCSIFLIKFDALKSRFLVAKKQKVYKIHTSGRKFS